MTHFNSVILPGFHLASALATTSINGGATVGTTHVSVIAFAILGGIIILAWIITLIAQIKIISKAGYSGWWILVTFVPVLNVIMFFVFAFSEWPVRRELRLARAGMPHTAYPGAYPAPYPGTYPGAYPGNG